jgi:hypothetical protein
MLIKLSIVKKLPSGKYRLYSKKKDKSGKRRNLGTFDSLSAVKKHEKAVQYFKHHADDGCSDDKVTHIVGKMSDIAGFLEEAGFIDSADRIYKAMDALDGSLSNDEDNVVDMFVNTDEQMNVGGGQGFSDMSPGHGGPSMSMDMPQVVAKLIIIANKLDKLYLYDEADDIDSIISKLEEIQQNKDTEQTKNKNDEYKKQDEDVAARSNGHDGISAIDNQNCGMFSGLSDAYFYRGYGDLEGPYK